jgi:ABC-2 type transport system permease protein
MNKLLAVIKREYLERARSKFFIIMTLLTPLIMAAFAVLPTLFLTLKTGGPTRLAIADLTPETKLYAPVRESLLKAKFGEDEDKKDAPAEVQQAGKVLGAQFDVRQEMAEGRNAEALKQALNARIAAGELDAYVILPAGLLQEDSPEKAEFFGRNVNDFIINAQLERAVNDSLRGQRLGALGMDAKKIEAASQKVEVAKFPVSEKGEIGKKDDGGGFWGAFFIGLLIYMTIITYGMSAMTAVIDEKGTRISEILFSSVNSFTLMMGKLLGVSLVGLTQYIVWALMYVLFTAFGLSMMAARGFKLSSLPSYKLSVLIYLVLYFLIGYFIYAGLYILIGAMVTTTQEGQQVSMPLTYTLIIGFMVSFAIIRNPDSQLAVILSMIPLFSPIIMPLRIAANMPPLWQMLLSLTIGFASVVGVVWLAARVYRVGMLMYGKKATIPEVARWIRQA